MSKSMIIPVVDGAAEREVEVCREGVDAEHPCSKKMISRCIAP